MVAIVHRILWEYDEVFPDAESISGLTLDQIQSITEELLERISLEDEEF